MSRDVDVSFAGRSIADALADEGVDFGVMDTEGEGLIGAVVRGSDRPGSPGRRWVDTQLPDRLITVHYSLSVASEASHDALEDRLRIEGLLNGLLHTGRAPARLEFSHLPGYFLARLVDAPKAVRYAHILQGSLIFECPQPFRYVDQEHTTSPSGGTVAIESNHYVEPVILWETSSTVGAAWIEIDGERLTIDTQTSGGQQIRIDCARKETRVGGVLNVENIHGTYPQVRDGSVVSTSPGGEMSFTYQERWI